MIVFNSGSSKSFSLPPANYVGSVVLLIWGIWNLCNLLQYLITKPNEQERIDMKTQEIIIEYKAEMKAMEILENGK